MDTSSHDPYSVFLAHEWLAWSAALTSSSEEQIWGIARPSSFKAQAWGTAHVSISEEQQERDPEKQET